MRLLYCRLTLHDTLYFVTREMGVLYETERYLHNYALAYALFSNDLVGMPFFCNFYKPRYAEDLGQLNEAAVYVTPAQPLVWDYVLVTWKIGQVAYYRKSERFGENKQNYPANIGRAKELAPESVFEFYVLSEKQIVLPRWIRLGKWMSKALVEVREMEGREREGAFAAACALNPLDVPEGVLQVFDVISMPPSSLVANARLEGRYYEVGGPGRGIPLDMRFTIPELQQKVTARGRRK
jgi:CRISPR-associated protein Csc1